MADPNAHTLSPNGTPASQRLKSLKTRFEASMHPSGISRGERTIIVEEIDNILSQLNKLESSVRDASNNIHEEEERRKIAENNAKRLESKNTVLESEVARLKDLVNSAAEFQDALIRFHGLKLTGNDDLHPFHNIKPKDDKPRGENVTDPTPKHDKPTE